MTENCILTRCFQFGATTVKIIEGNILHPYVDVDAVVSTDDNYLTSRFDLRIGGEIAANNDMLYRPFIRTSFTNILSGAENEISARLAGAPDDVPFFTQLTPLDDNYVSYALGLDILARENWILSFAYDRQVADQWDADSFFAKITIDM